MITMRRNQGRAGLADLIKKIAGGRKISVLEIGSFSGESAEIMLGTGLVSRIYCVDPWAGGFDPADVTSAEDFAAVERLFDLRFLNDSRVVKVKGTVDAFVRKYRCGLPSDPEIDLVYIDGCHTYDAVKLDISAAVYAVRPRLAVGGHDYDANHTGVVRAVGEMFGRAEFSFRDTSWLVSADSLPKVPSLAAHVSFFGNAGRVPYLDRVVSGLSGIPGCDVYVHTDRPDLVTETPHVSAVRHDLTGSHPYTLCGRSRETMASLVDKYDYQMYIEDDVLFTAVNWLYYLRYVQEARSIGRYVGFMRYELNRGNGIPYITDLRPGYTVSRGLGSAGDMFTIGGEQYCALFILSKDELREFMSQHPDTYWLRGGLHYGGGMAMYRENAAIGPVYTVRERAYASCPGLFVRHMPDNYANRRTGDGAGTVPASDISQALAEVAR